MLHPDNSQEAYLVTYNRDDVAQIERVQIHSDHDWSKGPYQSTVPFAVGSNQQIVSEHDLLELFGLTPDDLE